METVLSVALIVAITSFFKTQFELSGKSALLVAGAVSLVIAFIPQLTVLFPAMSPWFDALFGWLAMFLGAAGAYDTVIEVSRKVRG